jgi:hypothetical protein
MYEPPSVPPPRTSIHWIWSALAGLAVGAGVATGIMAYLMHRQERRHQADWVAAGIVNPGALIAQTGQLVSGAGPAIKGAQETTPTKYEIAAYLDGKTLLLPDADKVLLNAGEKSGKSHVMKKDEVVAVEKNGGWSVSGGPWTTPLVFLYDAGDARYAVEAEIQTRPVGGKSAFFGFTVKSVAKQ